MSGGRRVLVGGVAAVLVAAAVIAYLGDRTGPGKLPASAPSVTGGTVDLASLRGRPILLNFWGSWCLPCLQEMPLLRSFWRRHGSAVALVGVDEGEPAVNALYFVRQHGYGWAMVHDAQNRLATGFGVNSLPTTIVLDRRGRVLTRLRGPVTQTWLDAVLSETTGRVAPAARPS